MEDQCDPWAEISGLIALEKKAALDDFHRREFVPGTLPARLAVIAPKRRPVMRRAVMALAASLIIAAGLASLWLLKGSWGSISSAQALAELLSDSYLYSRSGSAETAVPATVPAPAANPYFSTWVEAGLALVVAGEEPVDPQAPVEHGDPVEVRRKLKRVIRENALERLLTQFREIHNKEV